MSGSTRNRFIGFWTKTCFVVLEKLDEKLINQYLQKCGLEKTTKNVAAKKNYDSQSANKNTSNCKDCIRTKKILKPNGRRKRGNLENSVIKSEFLQKKRKTKNFDYANYVSNKSVFEKKEPVTEDDKSAIFRVVSDVVDNREETCSRLNQTYEDDKSVTMKCKEKSTSGFEEKINNVFVRTLLEDSGRNMTENHAVVLSTADNEIEIIEEYLNLRNIPQNRNCDKTETNYNKEESLVNDDPVQAIVFEEDEYDSREENEDDKKTVIFEEGFYKDRNSDFFDIEEKEIELSRRKLKKSESTNRKIQELIKSKTKSVEGKTSGTESKPEAKIMGPSIGQEVIEVSPSLEKVSEECLKEVCCLVQRLHELYKVILHMQMKLQDNNGLSVHFSNAINALQEQFQREIRKSQKTIITFYENMLLFYKNAEKVALIISKRTSLSAKEVIEVISQCLLVEGACQLKNPRKKSIQKARKEGLFQLPKASYNSGSSRKIINDDFERLRARKLVQKTNYLVPPSNSYFPTGKNSELSQRVPKKSMILRTPTVENSEIRSQNPADRVIRISLPKHQMQRTEQKELKSYLVQKQTIQKLQSKNPMKNSGIDQSQQTQCARLVMLPYDGQPINGLSFPNHNVILSYPKSDCPANGCRFKQSSLLTMSSTSIVNKELPLPEQFLNCSSKNSSANHVDLSNTDISNSGSKVLVPMVAGDIVQCNILPYQNNLLNSAFLAKAYSGIVNTQRKILTSSNKTRWPLNGALMDSIRFPNQKFVNFLPNGSLLHSEKMAKSRSRVDVGVRTELGNVPNRVLEDSQVFDPTIPKKLTMKNWRLQAGPILDPETEEENVTESRDELSPCQSLEEKNLGYHELGNSDQEDSKSREYICAQKDCRKPGVLICGGCQSIIYCSEICQRKNWAQKHMVECYQLKKLRG